MNNTYEEGDLFVIHNEFFHTMHVALYDVLDY